MNGELLAERPGYRLYLVPDYDAPDLREEYDHLAHVVNVPDRGCRDIDKDGGPLGDAWRNLLDRYQNTEAGDIFERYARMFHGAVTLADNSWGVPVAVWYLLPEQARETNDPMAYLKGERDEYRMWARGEVYGYVIERRVTWRREDAQDEVMHTWETYDSCFGYVGHEDAVEQARGAWDAVVPDKEEN